MPAAKNKTDEKATIPVKLNLTPSELALVQEACEIQHARRHGPWIRDAALAEARRIVAEKRHPAFHMGRPVDAAENIGHRVDKPRRGGR